MWVVCREVVDLRDKLMRVGRMKEAMQALAMFERSRNMVHYFVSPALLEGWCTWRQNVKKGCTEYGKVESGNWKGSSGARQSTCQRLTIIPIVGGSKMHSSHDCAHLRVANLSLRGKPYLTIMFPHVYMPS